MKDSISSVPGDGVGAVVQDFIDDGAMHVVVVQDDDGTFTITAMTAT